MDLIHVRAQVQFDHRVLASSTFVSSWAFWMLRSPHSCCNEGPVRHPCTMRYDVMHNNNVGKYIAWSLTIYSRVTHLTADRGMLSWSIMEPSWRNDNL